MNFNSLEYLLFLPSAIFLYYFVPPKVRNLLLLLLSYGFYMCWKAEYALLILSSTVITYGSALLMQKQSNHKKIWLLSGLFLNLVILFFFKYFNFAADVCRKLLDEVGLVVQIPSLSLLLPVGISFYTFQAIGYVIDVYRGTILPERNFINYALFVSFFPQLVAGPIERSENLLPQFQTDHNFSMQSIRSDILPILWGLFKKIVIADQLAVAVNTVYASPTSFSGIQLAVATVCFAFQIYCDFSAYSDIARGSAAMLGFRLMKNFHAPYFAVSVRDFWRRWHISLSSWFRDYVYFPLGGSHCSIAKHCINLMIVFLLSGLWHGTAVTFVIWGLLNGLYQVIELMLETQRKKRHKDVDVSAAANVVRTCLKRLVTFGLISISWVFFRAETTKAAIQILGILFGVRSSNFTRCSFAAMGLSTPVWILLTGCIVLLLGVDAIQERLCLEQILEKRNTLRYIIVFLLIAGILIFGCYGTAYDPQDFVYFRF